MRRSFRQDPSELFLTRLGILVTLVATVAFLAELIFKMRMDWQEPSVRASVEIGLYAVLAGFLIYGNLVYQVARLGQLRRLMGHRRTAEDKLRTVYSNPVAPVTMLVPSYKEEERVIRQALLSATLQEYPNRHVVLLIDDPPNPTDPVEQQALRRARQLSVEIMDGLSVMSQRYAAALQRYLTRQSRGYVNLRQECLSLAECYQEAAGWFEDHAKQHPIHDHTDALFVEKVLQARTDRHRATAQDLRRLAECIQTLPPVDGQTRIRQEYHRLAALFSVTVSSFERKRYRNLSHEPNKAMNLNAYIGLMGKSWRPIQGIDGLTLEESAESGEAFPIPDAMYLITLDADSILLPEYAVRLIQLLEQPGNERVAVIQTPYSAMPNAPNSIERVAGATTDIQYFVHQGFSYYGATFWVGANAVLRKSALEEVARWEVMYGVPVCKYIQDRTLIEDTDSTVDLLAKGWSLVNYPERLSYSATPPDLGALVIQRGRWANGGLLIAPRLLAHILARPRGLAKLREGLIRLHYLVSLAGVSIVLIILFAWPTVHELNTWWLPVTALPYYVMYARDLRLAGYARRDVARVYALNVLLIAVHLMGTLRSLRQAWTGKKSPFKRTPKVLARTRVPVHILLLEFGFLVGLGGAALVDCLRGHWLDGSFALVNAAFLSYALWRFVGLRVTVQDLAEGWRSRRRLSFDTPYLPPIHP